MIDVHTIARQLTDWHTHRQPYHYEGTMSSWDAHHETRVPPLIDQLNQADKRAAESGQLRGTPTSRPAANLEALDTLAHIDHESAAWIRKLGHDDPGSTIACIRRLYSLAASADYCGRTKPLRNEDDPRHITCCDAHRIEVDLRRWWTQARICSGWDQAAWKPNNTCPRCDERRSLRIRVDDQTALCVNCRETWEAATIGLLAEHVRVENGEGDDAVNGEAAS